MHFNTVQYNMNDKACAQLSLLHFVSLLSLSIMCSHTHTDTGTACRHTLSRLINQARLKWKVRRPSKPKNFVWRPSWHAANDIIRFLLGQCVYFAFGIILIIASTEFGLNVLIPFITVRMEIRKFSLCVHVCHHAPLCCCPSPLVIEVHFN